MTRYYREQLAVRRLCNCTRQSGWDEREARLCNMSGRAVREDNGERIPCYEVRKDGNG